ncbi:MAG: prolyl oligopeptidase family serine peptidase [Bacteroidota bacterium]
MKTIGKLHITIALVACLVITMSAALVKFNYPKAKRVPQKDDYHGIQVSDPYRWMEDVEHPEVQTWMEAQEKLLKSYVGTNPLKQSIMDRMEALRPLGSSYSAPVKRGDHYFYQKNDRQSRHAKHYSRKGLQGIPILIFDPNPFFEERDINPSGVSVSPSGKYLAFGSRKGQNSFGDLHLLEVASGKILKDQISGLGSVSLVWLTDDSGFYYVDYGDAEEISEQKAKHEPKVKFHKIGTEETEDIIAYETSTKDKLPAFNLKASPDNKYLIITVFEGTRNQNKVYFKNLPKPTSKVNSLLTQNDFIYTYLGSKGDNFWFFTNHNAPNGRIIQVKTTNPNVNAWRELISETDESIAGGSSAGGNAMTMAGEKFVLLYRKGPIANIKVFDLKGNLKREVPLESGWLGSGIVGDWETEEAWYSLTTFTAPTQVYRLDLESGTNKPFFELELPIKQDDYVTKHVFYKSKDGTKVPMFIAHRKDLKLNGQNPAYMYGYGFGGWVATPWYQPHMLTWLDMGGVYAMPGIRGGGEYGEAWRQAGIRLNRQNAIDDYLAAAEYLSKEGYTSGKHLVANGWSASGSLAAAAVMQRPDLFGAGLIGIPSLDLLRYNLFTPFKGWTRGYGSPDIKEEFNALYAYSPYHNIEQGECYPPMLVTVGEKDQTTPPQHGYKFVARMQHHNNCDQPVMLKIVRGGGHSFGTTWEQTKETHSDEFVFLLQSMGLEIDQTKLSSLN